MLCFEKRGHDETSCWSGEEHNQVVNRKSQQGLVNVVQVDTDENGEGHTE